MVKSNIPMSIASEMLSLRKSGASITSIAESYGYNRASVRNAIAAAKSGRIDAFSTTAASEWYERLANNRTLNQAYKLYCAQADKGVVDHISINAFRRRLSHAGIEYSKLGDNGSPGIERIFISPDGEIHTTTNMAELCRKYGLYISGMSNVWLGKASHHKGWRAVTQPAQ